jgi:amino acid transporter
MQPELYVLIIILIVIIGSMILLFVLLKRRESKMRYAIQKKQFPDKRRPPKNKKEIIILAIPQIAGILITLWLFSTIGLFIENDSAGLPVLIIGLVVIIIYFIIWSWVSNPKKGNEPSSNPSYETPLP